MADHSDDDIQEIQTPRAAVAEAVAKLRSGKMTQEDLQEMMKDSALFASVEAQLHGASSMPPEVKRRVKALKQIQSQHVQLESQFHRELAELERKYAAISQPIFEKRASIITGKYEPTDAESAWEDDEAEEGEEEPEEEAAEDVKGIPSFWLTCFQNCEPVAQHVEPHDSVILQHLEDVQLASTADGFRLDFHFAENEYFTNQVLTLTYTVTYEHGPEELMYEGVDFVKAVGTPILWEKDKDVTFKLVKKKQKKKGSKAGGAVRVVEKKINQPSFFRLFSPPESPGEDAEEDEDEAGEQDRDRLGLVFQFGDILKDKIVPNAVLWFTGEANNYEDEEEDEGSEMEEEDVGGGDDDEDPDYVPPPQGTGNQPPECKQS